MVFDRLNPKRVIRDGAASEHNGPHSVNIEIVKSELC